MADRTALLDDDGLDGYDAHQHPAAFNISPLSPASASAPDDAHSAVPTVIAYSSDFRPSQPWSYYFTINSLIRRKTTAIVMQEAAEDSGNPTPPSHSSTSRPPTPDPSEPAPILPPAHPQAKVGLAKVLTVYDVIAYGVSSTIGAGIFVSTGAGALSAGPAVMVSFLLASVSCLFSAFAYCEFASRVPVSGSAYTFTYVTLGELAAWFIGWNLTLEYCISAAAVARAWASNFLLFFSQVGLHLPEWLASVALIKDGEYLQSLSPLSAVICIVCTLVLLLGVKESSRVNMAVTVMNVSIILFIIIAGATYISVDNYTAAPPLDNVAHAQQCNTTATSSAASSFVNPFLPTAATDSHTRFYSLQLTSSSVSAYLPPSFSFVSSHTSPSLGKLPVPPPAKGSYFPKGLNGVLTGAAQVFFSYVGFDSVTTLAEEVKRPKARSAYRHHSYTGRQYYAVRGCYGRVGRYGAVVLCGYQRAASQGVHVRRQSLGDNVDRCMHSDGLIDDSVGVIVRSASYILSHEQGWPVVLTVSIRPSTQSGSVLGHHNHGWRCGTD